MPVRRAQAPAGPPPSTEAVTSSPSSLMSSRGRRGRRARGAAGLRCGVDPSLAALVPEAQHGPRGTHRPRSAWLTSSLEPGRDPVPPGARGRCCAARAPAAAGPWPCHPSRARCALTARTPERAGRRRARHRRAARVAPRPSRARGGVGGLRPSTTRPRTARAASRPGRRHGALDARVAGRLAALGRRRGAWAAPGARIEGRAGCVAARAVVSLLGRPLARLAPSPAARTGARVAQPRRQPRPRRSTRAAGRADRCAAASSSRRRGRPPPARAGARRAARRTSAPAAPRPGVRRRPRARRA